MVIKTTFNSKNDSYLISLFLNKLINLIKNIKNKYKINSFIYF